MKKFLITGFIALLNIGNAQAITFHFDGILDLYTGPTLADSASVSGDFAFSGLEYNSDLVGSFTGSLFGLPVNGDLTIPTLGNPVIAPLDITWDGNNFSGDLLLEFTVTSLEAFSFVSLDGDSDGVPGSVFSTGPKASSSLALSGQFSAVPLPPALWLFGSGLFGAIGIARRKKT